MPNSMLKNLPWRWYGVALVILVLDQITKNWASASLEYNIPVEIFTGFNMTLRHNYGAAFSFLADSGGWQVWFLGGLASVVSVFLIGWIAKLGNAYRHETIGLALVLGGALGNLYDRILLGYVVDFIEVYYQSNYWPAFNIADMAISCGAGFLILDVVVQSKAERAQKKAAAVISEETTNKGGK